MSMDGMLLSAWWATSTPALPGALLMRLYLPLSWAVVLAALANALLPKIRFKARWGLIALLAVWTCLPGPASPAYWLGLAFQAPSWSSVLLGAWLLRASQTKSRITPGEPGQSLRGVWLLLLPAVLLGYALLLDTLALLPLQLYSWGFSTALLLALTAWALLPWLLQTALPVPVWLTPAALLLFAFTRLPNGNVWDALMDPLLWLLAHGVLIRAVRRWLASGQGTQ